MNYDDFKGPHERYDGFAFRKSSVALTFTGLDGTKRIIDLDNEDINALKRDILFCWRMYNNYIED